MMSQPVQLDENELLLRIAKGDAAAFEEIYRFYAPQLIEFASARLHSLEAARDIVHDLFVHFWQERESIDIKISLRGFLFTATRYRLINYIRHHNVREKHAKQVVSLANFHLTNEEELYAKELESKLHEAVNELAPRMKEVFKMSRFDQLSTAEIAEKLGRSEHTIKNQLVTSVNQVRAKLSRFMFLLWWL